MSGNGAVDGGVPGPIADERRPLRGGAPPSNARERGTPKRLSSGGGWRRLRETVRRDSLFIRHFSDSERSSADGGGDAPPGPSAGWSDPARFRYEFTLRECLVLFVVFLWVGALGFASNEEWGLLDALYFTAVLLTTVGYGDVTPRSVGGKAFASAFSLVGVVFFGLVLGVLGSQLVETEMEDFEEVRSQASRAMESAFTRRSDFNETKGLVEHFTESGEKALSRTASASSLWSAALRGALGNRDDPELPSRDLSCGEECPQTKQALRLAVVRRHCLRGLASMLVVGVVVMAVVEQWGWVDGIYFCVVTSTTIGFGDVTPSTPLGKGFAILLIPLSVGAMGYILGNVAAKIVENRRVRMTEALWSKTKELRIEDLEALDEAGDGVVSKMEYIKFMLVAMRKVDGALFDELERQFDKLDLTGDGQLTKQDLKLMAKRRMCKVSHKLELYYYKKKLLNKKCSASGPCATSTTDLFPEREG